jgi:hypothetical protein
MKEKLNTLRKIIKTETGFDVAEVGRKRELTYARAVYSKVARSFKVDEHKVLSLECIGDSIGKNHASILHNIRSIFPYAMAEPKYANLYNRLCALVSEANFDRDYESTYKTIKELEGKLYELSHQLTEERVKCVELKHEIDSLRSAKDNKMLSMMEGLSEDEVKEVEDKMSIFVRAIKSRVYSYA